MSGEQEERRDVFLSHRGVDKPFVRRLAADIESTPYLDRQLTVWLDEAEIRPGQSIPAMVNDGLERSRFILLVMTPAYFNSESGWTDAEWHAALHVDPDNRRGRIIPVLAADCPHVPILLRHLLALDLRGNNYATDFRRLQAILRDEPLSRTVTYRGQLIRSNGRIDRATLMAERAAPDGDPDPVAEVLWCNLLPVERMPTYMYEAPIRSSLLVRAKDGSLESPSKSALKGMIRKAQEDAGEERPRVPAFRLIGDRVITFHDLEAEESLLAPIVDQESVQQIRVNDAVRDEDDRRVVISLLNMSLTRHLMRQGLLADDSRGNRFYFPPDEGKPREIQWKPLKKIAKRTVTKPYMRDGAIAFWLHQAAYMKVVFLASKFFVQITPTWLLTADGKWVKGGPEVGRVVIQWTGRERNLSVLYHVRFWTMMLRRGLGPITVRVGEQTMDVGTEPAFVEQSYGIANDQKNILQTLDDQAARIAQQEESIEVEMGEGDEEVQTAEPEELVDEDVGDND